MNDKEREAFEVAFSGKVNFERNEQHPEYYAHLPARQMWDSWQARSQQPSTNKPELTVWYDKMPESNGKSNWTAILMRKGDSLLFGPHMTIARSEYPDRVRYEADCVRHMIGELEEEPDMMAYDHDLHSGYKKKYDETKAHYYAECRDMFPRNSEAWNALNDKLLAMFEGL